MSRASQKKNLEVDVVVVVVGLFIGRSFFVLVARVGDKVVAHLHFIGAAAFVYDSNRRGGGRGGGGGGEKI